MLKREAMWLAVLFLVPASWCAAQAAPDVVAQHPWVTSVQNHVWKPTDNQVQTVTGVSRSPLTGTPPKGWELFEGAEVSRGYDTNPLTYLNSPTDTFTRFSGRLAFRRSRATGDLDLSYTGGGVLYHRLDTFNQSFHRAKFDKTFVRPRWNILGSADFRYVPDAPLFVFGTEANGSGVAGNPMANDLVLVGNNQPFYSSLAIVEATHSLTARSSVTGSFANASLRFINSGYVGNTSYNYSAGYNHQLTRRQTFGIQYLDKRFVFQNSPVTVHSRAPGLVLEDRILNRFMAHIEAGPEVYSISGPPEPSLTHWTWGLDADLEYTVRKSTFSTSYTHGTSSGSGVLVGSESHAATGRLEQRISEHWSGSAEGSWQRHVAITPGPAELSNLTVVMAGGEIDHRLFASESVYLRYTYANENRPPSCATVSCAVGLNREVVELGLKLAHSSSRQVQQDGK